MILVMQGDGARLSMDFPARGVAPAEPPAGAAADGQLVSRLTAR